MSKITFNANSFVCKTHETLLDTLLRAGQAIPHSCKQGICQSCLMCRLDKAPPALAQATLKDTLKQRNYFLACLCIPSEDMTVALPEQSDVFIPVTVYKKQLLAPDIMRLVVLHELPFNFVAGQFVNLQRADGLTRSYSIANIPRFNSRLEFHIRRLPNGRFSNWVFDKLAIGQQLLLSQPQGNCYYLKPNTEQPLLLIATGTGLAPLYGILHDALSQEHNGDIYLFHGSRHAEGLYLVNELRLLAEQFPHFHYIPCVSATNDNNAFTQGRVHEVAFNTLKNLKGWRVYLCGHPDMVKQSQTTAYLQGASLKDIYCDAFVSTQ